MTEGKRNAAIANFAKQLVGYIKKNPKQRKAIMALLYKHHNQNQKGFD